MENSLKLCIDIGKYSTKVSYQKDENLFFDFSGGYGEKSLISAVFYNEDTNEFVFGEYARGEEQYSKGMLFDDLVNLVANNKKYNIRDKRLYGVEIFSEYLKHIFQHIRGINPNIDYFEIAFVNKYNNKAFEKNVQKLIKHLPEIKKIKVLNNVEIFFYDKNIQEEGNYLFVDIGHSSFHFYDVTLEQDNIKITEVKENETCAFKNFEEHLQNIFKKATASLSEENFKEEEYKYNIIQLVSENKTKILNSYKKKKDVKIFFDFITPPFAYTVDNKKIASYLNEVGSNISIYLENHFTCKTYKKVCVVGYGTNYLHISNVFKGAFENAIFFKDDFYTSVGLNYFDYSKTYKIIEKTKDDKIEIYENQKEEKETKNITLGIQGNEFIPLWNSSVNCGDATIFVNSYVEDVLNINLALKNNDETIEMKTIEIDCFKNRDKGTIKLNFNAKYKDNKSIALYVKDMGFGSIYSNTNYSKVFNISL